MSVMITTIDNPFDPFDAFDDWFQWDTLAGYNTCSLLARIVNTSSELSIEQQIIDIERAIDTIVSDNVSGVHLKVVK